MKDSLKNFYICQKSDKKSKITYNWNGDIILKTGNQFVDVADIKIIIH